MIRITAILTLTATLTLGSGCSDDASGPREIETGPSAVTEAGSLERPRIQAEPAQLEFGKLLRGVTETGEFRVRNVGSAPLIINMVRTVCGCTIAKLIAPDGSSMVPKKDAPPDPSGLITLQPDEAARVVIELLTAEQALGDLHKNVSIHTNDPMNAVLRLGMHAVLAAPFVIEPSELLFGEIARGETKTLTTRVSAAELADAAITGAEGPEWAEVSVRRIEGDRFAIDVRLREDAPVGYLKGDLKANVDHPSFDSFLVPIFATVKSRLRFDTGNALNRERLDFELLRPGVAKTVSVTVENGPGDASFLVTGAEIDSKHESLLHAEVVTLEDGRRYRVDVTVTASPELKFLRGTLRIRTDHADQPAKNIPFQGWVDPDQTDR